MRTVIIEVTKLITAYPRSCTYCAVAVTIILILEILRSVGVIS